MSLAPRPRAHLAALAPVLHGSISDAELDGLGIARRDVIDFSVNTNPLGPSPAAVAAIQTTDWSRYPEDGAPALRRALARRSGVPEHQIVVGSGSVELLWLLALAYLEPGDRAVVVGPTFGEYARAVAVVGGETYEHRARADQSFRVDLNAVARLVRSVSARLVFLCNPNNPTGVLLTEPALEGLVGSAGTSLVVLDEAYRPFVDEPPATERLLERGNVVLLRSLTKDHALAGLRLGYLLASPEVAAALEGVRPPWNVNALAVAAGLAALGDEGHLERARAEVRRARAYLTGVLPEVGWPVLPSSANYLLVEVGAAAAMRAALLRHGVCVRDCTSFGLPGHVRVGLRTLADCRQLVAAFAACRADVSS